MVHAGRSLLSVEIYDVDLGLTLRNVYLSVECTGGFPGCLETPLCRKPPPSPGTPPPPPRKMYPLMPIAMHIRSENGTRMQLRASFLQKCSGGGEIKQGMPSNTPTV